MKSKSILNKSIASLLATSVTFTSALGALPEGERVKAGTAVFDRSSAGTLNIRTSNQAIIDYRSFNIGAGEQVKFLQPTSQSVTLNRVTEPNPTQILGTLQANGHIVLANPYGIFFEGGAVVNVGGIIAAAGQITDSDFLAGRMNFTGLTGDVENRGSIISVNDVGLYGAHVSNEGVITAEKGAVSMAAGSSVYVGESGSNIFVSAPPAIPRATLATPAKPGVKNSGSISAPKVTLATGDMFGMAIAQSGSIVSPDITLNAAAGGTVAVSGHVDASNRAPGKKGGKIRFAGSTIELRDAIVDASGDAGGGTIVLDGGHDAVTPTTVTSSGTITARGEGAGAMGGTVKVLGDHVGLFGNAVVDVSGQTGGGTALIGGDYQGKNPDIQNAARTYIGLDAQIRADALSTGDGGKVVVWADGWTKFYGSISARGGTISGNGGFVEVSGKETLIFLGFASTAATNGSSGTLLLDPDTLTITDGAATTGSQDANLVAGNDILAGDPNILGNTVSRGTIELIGSLNNVILEATGQITINNLVGNLLNISGAGRSIRITSTTSGGITFLDSNDEIRTDGGDIILQANGSGVLSNLGLLNAGAGTITLASAGGISATTRGAVVAFTNTTAGNVTITNSRASGMTVSGSNSFVGGNVSVTETVGALTVGTSGISTAATTVAGTPSGNIGITATAGGIVLTGNVTTGAATVPDGGGVQIATSGSITLNAAAGSVTGVGRLITGDAVLTGVGGNPGDAATSGGIGITAGAAGVTLTGVDALRIGGASVENSSGTATIGNLSITSGGAINSTGSPLQFQAGPRSENNVALASNGTIGFNATTGGIFATQTLGDLRTSQITTLSAGAANQAIEVTTSVGKITVNSALNAGDDTILLKTTGASQDITFSGAAASLTSTAGLPDSVKLQATGEIIFTAIASTAINTATNNGGVTLVADTITRGAQVLDAGTGRVTVAPLTASVAIQVGNISPTRIDFNAGNFSTTNITAGTLRVGRSTNTGGISVAGAFNPGPAALELLTAGTINGAGAFSGAGITSLSASAGTGITLIGASSVRSVTLTNSISGDISYTNSSVGGVNTLTVSGLNTGAAAGGGFTVSEVTGALTVGAGNISTKGGAVNLTTQKLDGLLTLTGNIDTTVTAPTGGSVLLRGDALALAGTVNAGSSGNAVLRPFSTGAVIGVEDAAQTFNVTNAALTQISAGGTITIGDAAHAGNISVARQNAITQGTKNIALMNQGAATGSIAILGNNDFTARNLTLNAGVAVTQASGTGRLNSQNSGNLVLTATTGIGTLAAPVLIGSVAGTFSADNRTGATAGDISVQTGTITLGGGGGTILERDGGTIQVSATNAAGNNIVIGGNLSAGATGTVILDATGTITEASAGAGTITGATVRLGTIGGATAIGRPVRRVPS